MILVHTQRDREHKREGGTSSSIYVFKEGLFPCSILIKPRCLGSQRFSLESFLIIEGPWDRTKLMETAFALPQRNAEDDTREGLEDPHHGHGPTVGMWLVGEGHQKGQSQCFTKCQRQTTRIGRGAASGPQQLPAVCRTDVPLPAPTAQVAGRVAGAVWLPRRGPPSFC